MRESGSRISYNARVTQPPRERALGERQFHLLMGGLFLGSTLIDPAMRAVTTDWDPPVVTWLTLAIGMAWIGRYTIWRTGHLEHEIRVLRDRVDTLEDWRRREEYRQASPVRRDPDGPH